MSSPDEALSFIGGEWRRSSGREGLDLLNPASAAVIGRVPLSPPGEVEHAAQGAASAFPGWRRTPAAEQVQYLFRLKQPFEAELRDLSRSITAECGSAWPARWHSSRSADGRRASSDFHGQVLDAVEFLTQKKVVIERWPPEWTSASSDLGRLSPTTRTCRPP